MRDDEIGLLLRSALPEVDARTPARDLWPQVVHRIESRPSPHWLDIVLAAAVITLLALVPQWFFILAYHL
jgi:hypothetical protein